jgi:hypothetical protein
MFHTRTTADHTGWAARILLRPIDDAVLRQNF